MYSIPDNQGQQRHILLLNDGPTILRKAKRWAEPRLTICFFLLFIAGLLDGCAKYRPVPLTDRAVLHALSPPDMEQVRLRAGEIKHPLLKPVRFDVLDGLSADEAAILAVIANPTLRALRDRKGVADAQTLQAGLLPNPKLAYSFEVPVGGENTGKVNAYGLGLDWDITSLITRNDRLDAARAHAASVDLGVAWQEWRTAEEAKLHVYRLGLAQERYALAGERERMAGRWHDLVLRAVNLGEKTAADLSERTDSLQKAKVVLTKAKAEVDGERLALEHALGMPPSKSVTLEPNIRIPFAKKIPPAEDLFEGIQERRLDLLALRRGYENQEARVRMAIHAQFPKISLGVSGGRDTEAVKTLGLGAVASVPFLDRNQGRIALERATRKQLFDEYTARVFEARADVARLVEALRATQQEIADLDGSLNATRRQVATYRKAADEGRVPVGTYYQAMNRLYDIRFQRLDIEERLVGLGVALEIASGRYSLFCGDSRAEAPERSPANGGSK